VINSSARLVFSSWRYDLINPLLRQLYWLKVQERIDYKPALLVYKCLQGVAPSYLADDLCRTADPQAQHRLRSASLSSLVVRRRTRLHVDVRRPSFSGRRLSSLEQFATPRHVCTVTACFLQSSEDLPHQMQFSLTILLCTRSDTCHYGHINCSYLLTYSLHTGARCWRQHCSSTDGYGGRTYHHGNTVSQCAWRNLGCGVRPPVRPGRVQCSSSTG